MHLFHENYSPQIWPIFDARSILISFFEERDDREHLHQTLAWISPDLRSLAYSRLRFPERSRLRQHLRWRRNSTPRNIPPAQPSPATAASLLPEIAQRATPTPSASGVCPRFARN